jgi:uncharacterized BrkB/YihY/UPF0761 family membrane protein
MVTPEPPPERNNDLPPGADPRREVTFRAYIDELGSRPVSDTRVDRARTRILDAAERLTTWGPLGPVFEVGWRVWRRDQEIAGSVLAAALAYRIFIWLLPLALVAIAVLGLFGRTAAAHGVSDLGLSSYIAGSVASTATTGNLVGRVVLIVSASLVFLYESYVLLRTLRAISAFAWRTPVRPMRRPARQTSIFLGLALALVLILSTTSKVAGALNFPFGLIMALVTLAAAPAFLVLVSMLLLPNRATDWHAFLPGALLIYATYTATHLLATLVVGPWVAHKQATYGVLGISAGLLFLMFVFGRIIELSFSLNAVLVEQSATDHPVAAEEPAPK